jgi:hypothetical protein
VARTPPALFVGVPQIIWAASIIEHIVYRMIQFRLNRGHKLFGPVLAEILKLCLKRASVGHSTPSIVCEMDFNPQ